MNIHKNARLTPLRREEMARCVIAGRLSKAVAARTYGVTAKVVRRWVERFRCEGPAGMADRSSRQKRSPKQTAATIADEIATLRRQRLTGKHIAKQTGVSAATVRRVLRRAGLSRLKDIEPAEPVRRYEREKPGEMLHLDIKKLGRFDHVGHRITGDRTGQSNSRGIGWEFVHVCIRRRLARRLLAGPAGRKTDKRRRLPEGGRRLLRTPRRHGRTRHDRQRLLLQVKSSRQRLPQVGPQAHPTKPYTPKTNGKAERFIQTALREWAYAVAYPTSGHRAAELPAWLHRYNWHRPHRSLKSKRQSADLA